MAGIVHSKIGGVWKQTEYPLGTTNVKVGGSWRICVAVWVKVGGAWKQTFGL